MFRPAPHPTTHRHGGRRIRFLLILLLAPIVLAAACPARRDAVDEVPPDARRASVTLGETVDLFEGRLRVTFVKMERGGSFADVTLLVESGGGSVTEEVTAVRQREWSDAVRLAPWVVRVAGFPGVDSVRIAAWEGD